MKFKLVSDYTPCGDQPEAIEALSRGIQNGTAHQVLLGVTGSGKTYTVANVIERVQRPALVLAPNKTLAAQLYAEFKELFPENAVEYFVSYYDYYQPEAYVPSSDTYIEKDSSINEEIDRMRHAATSSLLQRRDVIVVASVSCIYGLGSPADYRSMLVLIQDRTDIQRDDFCAPWLTYSMSAMTLIFIAARFGCEAMWLKFFRPMKRTARCGLSFSAIRSIRSAESTHSPAGSCSACPILMCTPTATTLPTANIIERAADDIRAELSEKVARLRLTAS